MQNESECATRHLYIKFDPDFPINAPYANKLHSPDAKPARYLHDHASLELGLCQRGSGLFHIGGTTHPFSRGAVSVVAPYVYHIAQSNPDDVSGWQFIDIDLANLLIEDADKELVALANRVSGVFRNDWLKSLIERLLQILREDPGISPARRDEARRIVALVAHELRRLAPDEEMPAPRRLDAIAPAVVFISRNFERDITAEQLAKICSLSVSGFRRVFTNAMGIPPFQYLRDVRIKSAVTLLKTTALSISEISDRVGYRSLSSFNRQFREVMQASPSEYKKMCEP